MRRGETPPLFLVAHHTPRSVALSDVIQNAGVMTSQDRPDIGQAQAEATVQQAAYVARAGQSPMPGMVAEDIHKPDVMSEAAPLDGCCRSSTPAFRPLRTPMRVDVSGSPQALMDDAHVIAEPMLRYELCRIRTLGNTYRGQALQHFRRNASPLWRQDCHRHSSHDHDVEETKCRACRRPWVFRPPS